MKRYFLVAKDVGDLTRIFCAGARIPANEAAPWSVACFRPFRHGDSQDQGRDRDFVSIAGRLNIAEPDVFDNDPVNLDPHLPRRRREQLLFHPDAIKHIARSLRLIDDELRHDPRGQRLFLDLLTARAIAERILRQMNESGVLGRFVPDFGKIVALMQFNMYHHYTVDEHLIRAVGVMAEIAEAAARRAAADARAVPRCRSTTARLLYVALFLHDIAKGRPEDHSIAGAQIAAASSARASASVAAETDTVAWLIESSPADERDRPDARSPGPQDDPRLRRRGADPGAAGAADDPHRLRHPRGRARASGTAGRASCCARSTMPPSRCCGRP